MTFERATLDLTAHNERISQLWRAAMLRIGMGQSAKALLILLEQEQSKCDAYGCYKETA